MLKSAKKIVIRLLDYCFLLIVVTPLMVIIWYSFWSVQDYLISSEEYQIISAFVALGGQFLLLFFYQEIEDLLSRDKKIISTIFSSIYGLISGTVLICFWRFCWILYDCIALNDDNSIILNIVQNSLILLGFKVFVNTISVPFIARFKPHEPSPQSVTYFGKSKTDGIFIYSSDCFCTILIYVLIVFIWRDFWTFANIKIYPDNEYYSTIASLLIGYILAIICFLIHPTINFLCEVFIDFKVLYRNVHAVLCFIATVNIWRGFWLLFTILANGSIFINSTLCLSSFALLALMGNLDCLAVAPLLTDGKRIRFEHHYITNLLKPKTIANSAPENSKQPNV